MPAQESTSRARMNPEELRQRLRRARRVAVLTGAGISAESGIPTFRGEEGIWKKFRPEELATMEAFLSNPALVYEWYQFRRDVVARARPNPGHLALAAWEPRVPEFVLITQNIDGLHREAGSKQLLELHGNLWRDRCLECGDITRVNAPDPAAEGAVPRCDCGGRMRPDVVWFGELLPPGVMERACAAAAECDVFLSIGTSAVVQPAADLPRVAKTSGALLVEINPAATPLTPWADVAIFEPAGTALPGLLEVAV